MPIDLLSEARTGRALVAQAGRSDTSFSYEPAIGPQIDRIDAGKLMGESLLWSYSSGTMIRPQNSQVDADIMVMYRESALANVVAAVEPELIKHVNEIGAFGSRYADSAKRLDEYRFWRGFGSAGARWLIRQIPNAMTIAQAWGIGDVLASLGTRAIDPVIESLNARPSDELADVLLSALGGMAPDKVAPWGEVIAGSLRPFLRHSDDAIRSRAVTATSVLPKEMAIKILQDRRHDETDADVCEAIEDEILRRS